MIHPSNLKAALSCQMYMLCPNRTAKLDYIKVLSQKEKQSKWKKLKWLPIKMIPYSTVSNRRSKPPLTPSDLNMTKLKIMFSTISQTDSRNGTKYS